MHARAAASGIAPALRGATMAIVLACALAITDGGCGDPHTSSSLEQNAVDGGSALELRAMWRYRSAKVDVDIHVLTTLQSEVHGAERCVTSAQLRIDKAVSGTTTYRMPDTACELLRIGGDGDLVLRDSPTGHDWSAEAIEVDTDAEVIRLGPWSDDASGISYRFALSSPECSDDSSCECPKLERHADGEATALEFARTCD
jgi:hypothetical protein